MSIESIIESIAVFETQRVIRRIDEQVNNGAPWADIQDNRARKESYQSAANDVITLAKSILQQRNGGSKVDEKELYDFVEFAAATVGNTLERRGKCTDGTDGRKHWKAKDVSDLCHSIVSDPEYLKEVSAFIFETIAEVALKAAKEVSKN